ncbi:hypothetical protein AGLY_012882 [Aphis glycines]|uniref:Uncharacterized protein n=1 Tax=Aphis glycines TaxID=307491 RepID=A0A6G0T8J2_APHGL|nr:hypothetical protein AGLY_012882 [Aphis glycines]
MTPPIPHASALYICKLTVKFVIRKIQMALILKNQNENLLDTTKALIKICLIFSLNSDLTQDNCTLHYYPNYSIWTSIIKIYVLLKYSYDINTNKYLCLFGVAKIWFLQKNFIGGQNSKVENPIYNFKIMFIALGGFQWQSEYPWYIIEFSKKSRKTKKKKVTEKREFLRKTSFQPNRFFCMVVTQKLFATTEMFDVDKKISDDQKYLKIEYKIPYEFSNFYEICRNHESLQHLKFKYSPKFVKIMNICLSMSSCRRVSSFSNCVCDILLSVLGHVIKSDLHSQMSVNGRLRIDPKFLDLLINRCSEEAIELMNYDVFNLLNVEIAFLVLIDIIMKLHNKIQTGFQQYKPTRMSHQHPQELNTKL